MNRVKLIAIGDFLAFWLSFLLIISIRFGQNYQDAISQHIVAFIILYLSWTFCFFVFGLYDIITIKPTIPHLNKFIFALVFCLFIGIFLFYLVPVFGISPKTNLAFQLLDFGIMSFFFRRIIYVIFSKTITRPVILVGQSSDINELEKVIASHPQLGLKITDHLENFKKAIAQYLVKKEVVYIYKNISGEISRENLLNLYKKNSEIINIAQAYEKYLQRIPVGYIDQAWIVENINLKENILYKITKKILDFFISIIVLIVTSPILLVFSILIYLNDKGPILYKQERVGLNGKIFELYKLRSMKIDAEKDGPKWSTGHNDTRITPIGKIIRKLHIDEIPQAINILKGDITLVGPRPERPEFTKMLEDSIPHYELRHIIKPGFTGWAQIKYKYANTVDGSKEKFEYDIYYIKNRNIFIDLGVILRTIQIIFTH